MADEIETGRAAPVAAGVVVGGSVDDRLLPAMPRISWGSIFGGAFAALGLWLLLYAFGLAIGLTAVDPSNPGSVRGSGIFTGIWGALAPRASSRADTARSTASSCGGSRRC